MSVSGYMGTLQLNTSLQRRKGTDNHVIGVEAVSNPKCARKVTAQRAWKMLHTWIASVVYNARTTMAVTYTYDLKPQ